MSLATNVFRRGGRYAFRARVPNDLVARFGRSEIIRSLKTTDPGMARRYASRVGVFARPLGQGAERPHAEPRADRRDRPGR